MWSFVLQEKSLELSYYQDRSLAPWSGSSSAMTHTVSFDSTLLSLGLSIVSCIIQKARVIILAPKHPLVLARVYRKGRGMLREMYPYPQFPFLVGTGLGRGGSGRHTVSSDDLVSHDNSWEEAASYSARS